MRFTLPYPPTVNTYWRNVNGRQILSAEARAYKQRAALIALSTGARPMSGDVACVIDIYRPARRGDTDNFLKALLDCLKGIAFVDDSQVSDIRIRRYDTDKANPRAEIEVSAA